MKFADVITSRPITASIHAASSFFLLRCECSGTGQNATEKTCVFGLNRPNVGRKRGRLAAARGRGILARRNTTK